MKGKFRGKEQHIRDCSIMPHKFQELMKYYEKLEWGNYRDMHRRMRYLAIDLEGFAVDQSEEE